MTPSHDVGGRPHYYFRMAVAPDNKDELLFLTASFSRSTDGEATLRTLRGYPETAGGHALGAPRSAISTTSGSLTTLNG